MKKSLLIALLSAGLFPAQSSYAINSPNGIALNGVATNGSASRQRL